MKHNMTAFIHLSALPNWLWLSHETRNEVAKGILEKILIDFDCPIKLFDCEAFCAKPSHIVTIEFDDPEKYHQIVENLRESSFFSVPYFEILQIITAFENTEMPYLKSDKSGTKKSTITKFRSKSERVALS